MLGKSLKLAQFSKSKHSTCWQRLLKIIWKNGVTLEYTINFDSFTEYTENCWKNCYLTINNKLHTSRYVMYILCMNNTYFETHNIDKGEVSVIIRAFVPAGNPHKNCLSINQLIFNSFFTYYALFPLWWVVGVQNRAQNLSTICFTVCLLKINRTQMDNLFKKIFL